MTLTGCFQVLFSKVAPLSILKVYIWSCTSATEETVRNSTRRRCKTPKKLRIKISKALSIQIHDLNQKLCSGGGHPVHCRGVYTSSRSGRSPTSPQPSTTPENVSSNPHHLHFDGSTLLHIQTAKSTHPLLRPSLARRTFPCPNHQKDRRANNRRRALDPHTRDSSYITSSRCGCYFLRDRITSS